MNKWAMLCKLKVEAFVDPDWRWEQKLDGDRMSALVTTGSHTRLLSRSGVDKTDMFPEICLDVPAEFRPAQFDGEVVSAQGLSFQEFNQRRMNRKSDIAQMSVELPGKFIAFDMLMVTGRDLAGLPLGQRRKWLDKMPVEKTEQFLDGIGLFECAKQYGWEGVVGKDMGQAYMPGKRAWVKVKRWLEGEFWVVGFTAGTGKRFGRFGALMLGNADFSLGKSAIGMYDSEVISGDLLRQARFEYVGDVGMGFSDAELERLDSIRCGMRMELGHRVLETNDIGSMLKVRVKYVEVTNAGSLRFPVYLGQVKEAL